MSNRNSRSWGSGRPKRSDPALNNRRAATSKPPSAVRRSDGFVESADFLPDWLSSEPGTSTNNRSVQKPAEEKPRVVATEETDDLASQLAALDRLYESEPAAVPDPKAAVANPPTSPSRDAVAIVAAEVVEADLPSAMPLPVSPPVAATPVLEETAAAEPMVAAKPEVAAKNKPAVPTTAAAAEPVLSEVTSITAGEAPSGEPEGVAEPIVSSSAPVVPSAAAQPAVAPQAAKRSKNVQPFPQLTPAMATSSYATPSRTATVVKSPARKAPQATERSRPRRPRTRKVLLEGGLQRVPVRIFDRFARVSLALVLLFGLLSFLILRFNPFAYFAIQSATTARPQTVRPPVEAPGEGSDWCLTGNFLDNARGQVLSDNGLVGDTVAGDRVFSLEQTIDQPGTYLWQVAACNDPQIVFPPEPTWVVTTTPNQSVLFTADASQRGIAHFVSAPYVVAADDSAASFRVIGDFQDWDRNDPTGTLENVGVGIYQHIRRLSQPDQYNAYIVATGLGEGEGLTAIDGYGRTTTPIPLTFRTMRRGETAVFLLDLNKGRATVLYNMNPFLTQIAYYGGNWLTGLLVGAVAAVIAFWLLVRSSLIWRHRSWLDAGCPRCHEHELMRVERQLFDRFLHLLGLPAYRYQCRHCTWQGIRLSVGGLSASPRSRLARGG